MKHNLLKSVIISVILLMGVSNAWGAVSLKYQKDMPSENYNAITSKTMTQSSANSDRYYCEISLTANSSYGFFIQNGSNYYKVDVTATSNNSVQLYDYGSYNYGNSNHRVTYKSGTAGTYIFTYDASNHKICVSPKSSETIKIAYDIAQGHDGDWNLNNYVNLTQVGSTANYTIDLDLQAKKYYMFVQISNSIYWRAGSTLNVDGSASLYYYGTTNYGNSGDKINFTPSTAGKYRFTWNHQDKTIKLEPFYSVIYNGNSHTSGSVPATSQHLKGSTVTVASNSGNLARTGYTFGGWNTNSTGTGTNYTAGSGSFTMGSSNTTLYANWKENKYNVVISTEGNGTTNQTGTQSIGIVGISITATPKIGSAFKQWEVTGGAKVANATSATTTITATAAGTVKAVFEEKPATTIYLEPTGHWNSHKAVFQAHVWQTGKTGVNLDMVGIGDPSHADGDNKSPYRYYKVEVPYGYDKILFFREDPANKTTIWNQTGDLTIPTDNKTLYEIKSTGDGTTTTATGVWKEANLVYTITLGYCDFGTYGFKYNGQSYFSKPKNNVTIDVPAGAQIEILEGQPHSNAYTGDVIKSEPTKEKLTIGQTLTINGDIMLDDNFVTKESHVVYLGVPDGLTDWTSGTYGNFLWSWNTMSSFSLIASTRYFKIGNTTYYEYTIPAGRHSLCFQRKTGVNDTGTPQKESVYLPFQIPLNEVNCFTLQDKKDGTRYKGTWGALPAKQGDHRLLYIEQKVEEENGHPNTIVTKAHPSDIIRQGDNRTIYSLHIYNQVEDDKNGMNDPEILLQECTGYNGENPIWTTRERHMVFGPLHADFGMAAMPGRRDAAGDPDAVLRYDNGIENIKNDINTTDPRFVDDQASGVWNFFVTRDANKNFTGLNLTETKRYTGEYYVRTDCADGGWDMYTAGDNHMHFSAVSKAHSNYSHYFCKWVESDHNVNVKYTIANDYGIAISDTLEADKTDLWGKELATKMVGDNQLLPANANVRFSWNEKTNGLHRAYIAGATNAEDRFLVLEGKATELYDEDGAPLTQGAADSDRYGLYANEEIFSDINNWVYQTDVQMIPNASLKVTAKYYNQTQYFIGTADEYSKTILQGTGSQKYLIRLLYDFKTNELISAYVPGNNTNIEAIQTNLMLIREGNNPATQLNFTTNNMVEEGRTAYGVIEFPYELLTGSGDIYQRSLYWISFPFDVNLQDAFGVGQYGVHWLIQEYDGERRAKEGLWAESDSFWKLHWDQNITLKAGFGYVIELDIAKICSDYLETFKKSGDCVALYFPSAQPISGDIVKHPENNDVSITIPAHQCTIPIRDTPYGNRQIRDSHWNVIGVPSYVNAGADFSHSVYTRPEERKLKFYYKWITYDNYVVADANNDNTYNDNFQSMFAYMVQYEGNLTWKSVVNEKTPQGLAARQNSDTQKEHNLRLELQQNGAELDRTFITLQEDDVTAAFDFNYDLCKVNNGGANIYSLIATDTYPIQVAGNVLPVENNVIPVGVIIRTAGEYTFAMPDGTEGVVVELIDYQANTTTNLLFNDYTVNLPKGTFENRFALSVKPDKTATSVENISNEATGDEVKKYIIDGVLYMQKDGVLYDAQGHIVR